MMDKLIENFRKADSDSKVGTMLIVFIFCVMTPAVVSVLLFTITLGYINPFIIIPVKYHLAIGIWLGFILIILSIYTCFTNGREEDEDEDNNSILEILNEMNNEAEYSDMTKAQMIAAIRNFDGTIIPKNRTRAQLIEIMREKVVYPSI